MREHLLRYPRRVDIVVPGTRFADATKADKHDQQQVDTPGAVVQADGDFLVVGRMVTAAKNPRTAMNRLLAEIREAEDALSAQAWQS